MKKEKESLRLRDLAKTRNSSNHRLYKDTIASAPIGNDCKRLLLKQNGNKPRPRNVQWQKEFIEMLETQKDQKDFLIEDMRIDLIGLHEIMNMAKAEYEDVLAELKEAEIKLRKAKKGYEKFKAEVSALTNEQKMLEDEISNEYKRLEQMNHFLLLHPSATITALDKKCGHTIVCTSYDQVDCCGVADVVEDTAILDLLEENVPEKIKGMFSSEKELYSAIEYAKLVLTYFIEDKKPLLLYDSLGITELLKLQGIL